MKRRAYWQLMYLPALVFAVVGFAQDSNRPLRAVGEFSNMRFTEEHAYGYTVDLWRDGDSILGLFLASKGLQGNTPTGMLENVKFNPRTGALSFTARLTMGATLLPGGGQEPSRDLFEFTGTLQSTAMSVAGGRRAEGLLTGTLQRSDARQPARPASRETVQLNLQPRADLLPGDSYAEWKRQTDEILKRRGPSGRGESRNAWAHANIFSMNPTPEPASERDLRSEIDEMKTAIKTVLEGLAAIGEDLERYKRFYDESADKFANVMTAIQDGLEKQTELNHTFANNLAENFKVLTAFDERLSALENRPRPIRPN